MEKASQRPLRSLLETRISKNGRIRKRRGSTVQYGTISQRSLENHNMPIPENIKALILDMDGVVWRGDVPIGDLTAIFNRIRERGLKFVFATNNSTKTSEQYVTRLKEFGVDVEPRQVITSSQAAAHTMAQKFPRGTKVFMIGEDGLRIALQEEGFEILPVEDAPNAEAVVIGMDRG